MKFIIFDEPKVANPFSLGQVVGACCGLTVFCPRLLNFPRIPKG
jgi:hypothetical protein